MPEEVAFFGRTSLYGLVIAVVYWFVSYDVAGTGLLFGFGLATGVGFVLLWRRDRAAQRRAGSAAMSPRAASAFDPDRPFTDERGPVPLGSFAPLEVGFGVAVAALGLVFGIWFILAAIIPVLAGAATWVREARREADLVASRDVASRHVASRDAVPLRQPEERSEPARPA